MFSHRAHSQTAVRRIFSQQCHKKLTCGTFLPLSTTAYVHLLLSEPANFIVWSCVYRVGNASYTVS